MTEYLADPASWRPLASSNVERVAYYRPTRTLAIHFHTSNATYWWLDVPEVVFNDLLLTSSPGKYVWYVLQPNHGKGIKQ